MNREILSYIPCMAFEFAGFAMILMGAAVIWGFFDYSMLPLPILSGLLMVNGGWIVIGEAGILFPVKCTKNPGETCTENDP